jgi:hypothetical protein
MRILIYNVLIGNQIVVQAPVNEPQLAISCLAQLKVKNAKKNSKQSKIQKKKRWKNQTKPNKQQNENKQTQIKIDIVT